MARNPRFLARWSQYFAVRMAGFLMTAVSPDVVLRALGAIGRVGHRFSARHRKRISDNLAHAMPELSETARRRISRSAFEHLAKLAGELAFGPALLRSDTWWRYIQIGDLRQSLDYINAGQPAIAVTGHIGNWELTGFTQALLGYPVNAIARPIDNPVVNEWVNDSREKRGLTIINKHGSNFEMTRILNDNGILGFVADQDAGRRGVFVPYFNRLASTSRSIALLAVRREVPVICGMCRRMGPGFKHEISATDVIKPADWQGQPDPEYYVTARYTRAIEMMVRACPEQYLWMHRRWKTRPNWEATGQPMPAAMEQKLKSLPWMTPSLLANLKLPIPT